MDYCCTGKIERGNKGRIEMDLFLNELLLCGIFLNVIRTNKRLNANILTAFFTSSFGRQQAYAK